MCVVSSNYLFEENQIHVFFQSSLNIIEVSFHYDSDCFSESIKILIQGMVAAFFFPGYLDNTLLCIFRLNYQY